MHFDISASYQHTFSSKHIFGTQISSINNFFNTDYNGSYNGKQKINVSENLLFLTYILNIQKFSLTVMPGVSNVYFTLNSDKKSSQWNPRLFISPQIRFNNSNNINIQLGVGNNSPNPSQDTEAIIKLTDLLWKTGNPELKTMLFSMGDLNYSLIPSNYLSLTLNIRYDGFHRLIVNNYIPSNDYNGLLIKPTNDGNFIKIQSNLGINVSFFNKSLILSAQGNFSHNRHFGNLTNQRLNNLKGVFSTSYYYNNINFNLSYRTPDKYIEPNNLVIYKRKSIYGLSVGYSIKNFKINLEFDNWFRRNSSVIAINNSNNYHSEMRIKVLDGRNRSLKLSMSYIFNYGKKINQNEFGKQSFEGQSAIIK